MESTFPRKFSDQWALQRHWIQTCCETYPECRPHNDDWMPTRVLEISEAKVRLLHPKQGELCGKYATLSHCWGKAHLIKPTKANIHFTRGIAFDILPNSYREAIDICHDLEVRYCWIDSLCIIQDDPDDWVHEAVQMGSVYRNSNLNIEAAHAEDGDGHLLFPWDKGKVVPLRLRFDTPVNGSNDWVMFNPWRNRQDDTTTAPLYKRAWVLQEQCLSPDR